MNPKTVTETLLQLQLIILQESHAPQGTPDAVEKLRASVPRPILSHFDRMVARGKRGVSIVRHGVCSECHMRLPTSMVFSLRSGRDVALCENCGCYMALAPEEQAGEPAPVVAKPLRPKRQSRPVAENSATTIGAGA